MTLTSSLASDQVLLKPSPPSAGASGRTWRSSLYESWRSSHMKATNFPFGQAFDSTNTYSDISNAKPSFGRRQHSVSLTFDQPPSLKKVNLLNASKFNKIGSWMSPPVDRLISLSSKFVFMICHWCKLSWLWSFFFVFKVASSRQQKQISSMISGYQIIAQHSQQHRVSKKQNQQLTSGHH